MNTKTREVADTIAPLTDTTTKTITAAELRAGDEIVIRDHRGLITGGDPVEAVSEVDAAGFVQVKHDWPFTIPYAASRRVEIYA